MSGDNGVMMGIKTTRFSMIERWQKRPLSPWLSWAIFLLLPLLSVMLWGGVLADDAYLSLRLAQAVGHGDDWAGQLLLWGGLGYTPHAPLAWLLLAVPEWLGWNTVWVATVCGALGWGITAVFWQKLLRTWRLPVVDWLVPLLLVVSPIVVMTQGSAVSWFVAVAWLAIWLTVRQKWLAQTGVLLLMLVVNVSITAVALIIILLVWRVALFLQRNNPHAEAQTWTEQGQSGHSEKQEKNLRIIFWLSVAFLVGISVVALTSIGWQVNQAPWQTSFPVADWLRWGRQWLYAGEFVWVLLLFAVMAVVGKRQTWPIAIWLLFALLDVNLVGQAVVMTGLLLLAGVGMAVIAQWLVQKQWFDVADGSVYLGAVLLLSVPLCWLMISSLITARHGNVSLVDEMAVGAWLQENSEADAVIMSDLAVGYFANRMAWSGNGRPDQQNWASFIRKAGQVPHDYIVTDDTLFWEGLKNLTWWQDRAVLAQSYGSLDIWQFAPQPVLSVSVVPLNVVLENGVRLVGYQQMPQTIAPGEAVNVSLHFQVDDPIGNGFNTVIWLSSSVDEETQAAQDLLTPRGVPSNWWEPGQIVTEQFVLTTTAQIPVGGHRMLVSFRTQDSFDKMPVYQNEDSNPLDRIQLGYVAVPWDEEIADSATLFNARFGDEFQLLAANLPGSRAIPGDILDIELYWEGLHSLARPQHDYTVFVHLLNEAGEMVANADGPPQGGKYPTGAWRLGDVVPDLHQLYLPAELPPGNYVLRVGAYLPETGERLPVFDEAGNALPGANVMLMALTVE